VSAVTGRTVEDLTFGGSVDFRLVFTVDGGAVTAADALELFPGATRLGRATDHDAVRLVQPDGAASPLPGKPWRHA
jgi:thiamine-monophosphate kinase